jgi:hypothetical protein
MLVRLTTFTLGLTTEAQRARRKTDKMNPRDLYVAVAKIKDFKLNEYNVSVSYLVSGA